MHHPPPRKSSHTVRKICGVITEARGRNITIGGHEASRNALVSLHDSYARGIDSNRAAFKSPITSTGAAITCGATTEIVDGHDLPLSGGVDSLIGSKAMVWAYSRRYNFVSTYEGNRGDIIRGWSLCAVRIKKTDDF